MPIQDWTRVDAGIFHDFHLSWVAELGKALNCGLLPSNYYSLAEQVARSIEPGVRPEIEEYTAKRRTLVIRHVSHHRIIALIEILSPGNKASRYPLRAFLRKTTNAITEGIHLLIADLFPHGPRDPQGIHGSIWTELFDNDYLQPSDKPLTLAAYSAGPIPVAYVEPVAVGDSLPDMPLFLTPEEYINVPLEATYQAAYAGVPRFYRNILEA